jgi:UrcA family protein
MKMTTQQAVLTAVMMASCVFGPLTALAQQPAPTAPESRSTNVSLAGLDLSTPEGMSAARERLRNTADRLCSQVVDELDMSHHANFIKCVDAAVTSALNQLTGPKFAAGGSQPSASKTDEAASAHVIGTKKVSFADLDLSTPEGARIAHDRLLNIANSLCFQVENEFDLSHHENFVKCVDRAMTQALPKIEELANRNAAQRGLASNLNK